PTQEGALGAGHCRLSCRLFVAAGREPPVEALALGRHIEEELRRFEALAVFRLEVATLLDELPYPHHAYVAQRAARNGPETETEDRTDVGLAPVREHMLLQAPRGFQGLDAKQPMLELLDVD